MILFTDTDNYQTRTESTLLISAKTRLILLFLSFSTNAILASALFWRQSTTHIEDVLCVLMFFTTFPYITSLYENAIATIARYVRVVQSWPLTEIKQSISCSNSRTSFIGILRLQPCMVRSKALAVWLHTDEPEPLCSHPERLRRVDRRQHPNNNIKEENGSSNDHSCHEDINLFSIGNMNDRHAIAAFLFDIDESNCTTSQMLTNDLSGMSICAGPPSTNYYPPIPSYIS